MTDVPYGYYYVKEMESSTGFILDEELHYVDATYGSSELTTVTAGDTTKYNAYVTSYETPGNDPIGITVYKEIEYAEDDELQLAEDYWSDMSGAIFKVTYYGGQYTLDEIESGQATKDGVVTRTWYITTKSEDEDGNTFYDDDGNIVYRAELTEYYLVNDDEYTSDELFYLDGEVAYPIGTYTIEEVATPDGYTATGEYYDEDGELVESANEVAVLYVKEDESRTDEVTITTGNIYEKSEVPEYGSLTIYKKDGDGNNLSDVTFLVEIWNEDATNEDGGSWDTVTSVTTDENGTATVTHLVFGTYRVTETKTQPGLTLLAEPMIFTIDSIENKNQYYDVLNGITFSMPMTGESGFTVLPFIVVGMVIAAVGVFIIVNKRRRYSYW